MSKLCFGNNVENNFCKLHIRFSPSGPHMSPNNKKRTIDDAKIDTLIEHEYKREKKLGKIEARTTAVLNIWGEMKDKCMEGIERFKNKAQGEDALRYVSIVKDLLDKLVKIIIKAPTLSDPLLLKLISKACIDFVHTNFNHAMYNLKQLVEADGVLQKNPYDKDALKTFRDCGNTIHRINATFDRYFEIIF